MWCYLSLVLCGLGVARATEISRHHGHHAHHHARKLLNGHHQHREVAAQAVHQRPNSALLLRESRIAQTQADVVADRFSFQDQDKHQLLAQIGNLESQLELAQNSRAALTEQLKKEESAFHSTEKSLRVQVSEIDSAYTKEQTWAGRLELWCAMQLVVTLGLGVFFCSKNRAESRKSCGSAYLRAGTATLEEPFVSDSSQQSGADLKLDDRTCTGQKQTGLPSSTRMDAQLEEKLRTRMFITEGHAQPRSRPDYFNLADDDEEDVDHTKESPRLPQSAPMSARSPRQGSPSAPAALSPRGASSSSALSPLRPLESRLD